MEVQIGERSLCKLLEGECLSSAEPDLSISSIVFDSRNACEGSLFFAVPGHAAHGLTYVQEAVRRGACAVVVEHDCDLSEFEGARVCRVENVRRALAVAAARFYGSPSRELSCVGVTGTNGKTSISWIVAEACGSIFGPWIQLGTLGARIASSGQSEFSQLSTTTPDPVLIQSKLREGVDRGARGAVIEASSHASSQLRTHSLDWDVLAFTNLTRDHLDYHSSMESYFEAKRRLFVEELRASTKRPRTAVVCVDNPYGQRLAAELSGLDHPTLLTVSTGSQPADIALKSADCSTSGSTLLVDWRGETLELKARLTGSFNVENLLISFGILKALGVNEQQIIRHLAEVPEVPGRIERVHDDGFTVFVDYAHTPAALEAVCKALRGLGPKRLIVVFGCGGDRDRGKRPLMGRVVRDCADFAIVTSDNPRSEDPQRIVDDTAEAFVDSSNYECIVNRREAIARAISIAAEGDVVLIAGKGHEPYQEINGVKHPFDDRAVARQLTASQVGN